MNKDQFDVEKVVSLISSQGVLSQKLKGFEVRTGQQGMLRDVLQAYLDEQTALIEAGTGTGKSVAYLLPALFWACEKKEITVISTNTIALQEQLIKKDIPFLLEALGMTLKVVLVKGMGNYLCLRKLEDLRAERRFLSEREYEELERIENWAHTNTVGSRSELGFTPSYESWEKVHAEAESCTHMKCPHYKKCFFFKARKEAEDAHILVSNHHLLFADLAARGEKDNYKDPCILPAYRHVILDEAHHVEDIATEHFAKKVSRTEFFRLINRLLSEKGGKLKILEQKLLEVYPEAKDEKIKGLLNILEIDFSVEKKRVFDLIDDSFKALLEFLIRCESEEKLRIRTSHIQHPFWISEIQSRVKRLLQMGRGWIQSIESLCKEFEENDLLRSRSEGVVADIKGLIGRFEKSLEIYLDFVFASETEESVRWIERSGSNIYLTTAKLTIAALLKEYLFDKMSSTVLCSATLAAKKEFKFIKQNLGIESAGVEKIYDSAFDYENQACLFVPLDMPDPDHPSFSESAVERIWEAIEASGGGAFVLFTSYAMLRSVREALQERFVQRNYRLLCQGEESAHALLHRFKSQNRSVLFGTDSFWEGVDVKGEALRCVIIVKLPFLVPSEPLVQAKSERLVKLGKSPFFDYSLPHATMKFKQGFGRLIRSQTDRGCVLCLDARLAKKGYGKVFLQSLPSCRLEFTSSSEVMRKMREFYRLSGEKGQFIL